MIAKAIHGLEKEGRPFVGVLYLGGIKTKNGLRVIEYNARWGDPEAQVIIPGIKTDYVDIVQAAIAGKLANIEIEEDDKVRVCIVGTSKGYPKDYSVVKGKQIFGLNEAMKIKGITVLGCGIKFVNEQFLANGGRLFNIVAEGKDVVEARKRANEAMQFVYEQNKEIMHYRRDIGLRDEVRFRAVA